MININNTILDHYIKNNPYRKLGLTTESKVKQETDKLIKKVINDFDVDPPSLSWFFEDVKLTEDIIRQNKSKIDKEADSYQKYLFQNENSDYFKCVSELCFYLKNNTLSESKWNDLYQRFVELQNPDWLNLYQEISFLVWWEKDIGILNNPSKTSLNWLAKEKYSENKAIIEDKIDKLSKKYDSTNNLHSQKFDDLFDLENDIKKIRTLNVFDISTGFIVDKICGLLRQIAITQSNKSSDIFDKEVKLLEFDNQPQSRKVKLKDLTQTNIKFEYLVLDLLKIAYKYTTDPDKKASHKEQLDLVNSNVNDLKKVLSQLGFTIVETSKLKPISNSKNSGQINLSEIIFVLIGLIFVLGIISISNYNTSKPATNKVVQLSQPVYKVKVIDDKEKQNLKLRIRATPCGDEIGEVEIGDSGKLMHNSYQGACDKIWYKVIWDNGKEGWSISDRLKSELVQ